MYILVRNLGVNFYAPSYREPPTLNGGKEVYMGFLEGLGSVLSAVGEAAADSYDNKRIYKDIENLARDMAECPVGSYKRQSLLVQLDRAIRDASKFERRLKGR